MKKRAVCLMVSCLMAIAVALPSCAPTVEPQDQQRDTTGEVAEKQEEQALVEQLAEVLTGDVLEFQLVKIDVAGLGRGLERGIARLPLVNEKGEVVELELPAQRIQLREPHLTTGYLKGGTQENPSIEEVALPREQNFRLGGSSLKEFDRDRPATGALTIMDVQQTMVSGMVIEPSVGVTFFEPVDLILGGRSNPGLHILYNLKDTAPVVFPDEEQPSGAKLSLDPSRNVPPPGAALAATLTYKQTKVVLDGDVTFYNIDAATVWSRQEAIHNVVSVIYGIVEPFSSVTWGLHIRIKGQEVWDSGGPSSTDGDDLLATLTRSFPFPYYLMTQVNEDELHHFFVGYSMASVFGQAAGIGTVSGGFGGGRGQNHAFSEARSSQSLKTHWVIMAHEMGHLLGGVHRDADLTGTGCAGGFFSTMCGLSIMAGGGAGAPDVREGYFSDENDRRIEEVIDPLLEDG